MISRVANACFWLNRYMERVESLARWQDVNASLIPDVDLPPGEQWRPLVVVVGEEPSFLAAHGAAAWADGEAVQQFLTWDERSVTTVRSALAQARENARTIRETISLEMWVTINDLWLWLHSPEARKLYQRDRSAFLTRVRDSVVTYHGHSLSTILHEEPFDFMRLGTTLERANLTARILDIRHLRFRDKRTPHEMPRESAQWLAILRSCSGIEPFFKRSALVLSGDSVTEFLLFDPRFPRSVLHNVDRAVNFVRRLQPGSAKAAALESLALLDELAGDLRKWTLAAVLERGLHKVLTEIVARTAAVGDAIHRDFFEPPLTRKLARPPRQERPEAGLRDYERTAGVVV
jgi:uncharacterized alpha-E superfamily protein